MAIHECYRKLYPIRQLHNHSTTYHYTTTGVRQNSCRVTKLNFWKTRGKLTVFHEFSQVMSEIENLSRDKFVILLQ